MCFNVKGLLVEGSCPKHSFIVHNVLHGGFHLRDKRLLHTQCTQRCHQGHAVYFCSGASYWVNMTLDSLIVMKYEWLKKNTEKTQSVFCTDACALTLDTNTAAKSLFLYDSGKQVTWVRERQQYPDHPDRFESVSQVLCHQGLTHRHYWEVEWRGRWVDVAVAVRGIRRRASSHLCGFGYTEHSWSLFCSEDHYSAQHDHEKVEIPAPPSCSHKVGVYLDWPGGTLSFYSVYSGNLSHLYTFYSTFTEPLYPGFGMEEDDCSVIICTEDVQELISRSASIERLARFWVWVKGGSNDWRLSNLKSNLEETRNIWKHEPCKKKKRRRCEL